MITVHKGKNKCKRSTRPVLKELFGLVLSRAAKDQILALHVGMVHRLPSFLVQVFEIAFGASSRRISTFVTFYIRQASVFWPYSVEHTQYI
jgi:hypothetical protein